MESLFDATGAILTSHEFAIGFSIFVLISPALVRLLFKQVHHAHSIQSTAVSLGILGTFLGIFGGMLTFDVNDIQGSIPVLLGGLQMAFLTPIAGMVAALTVKHVPGFYGIRESDEDKDDQEQLALIRQELSGIARSLSGDEETTLLTQIQKLRTSMSDKQDELNKSFREFAAKMAEDNKMSLIEALKEVIRDFNAKINEQFGENFKHLNEGVGKMLEWQENYTKQVETAVAALEVSNKSMEMSKTVLEASAVNASEFHRITKELNQHLETMGVAMSGIKSLGDSLKGSGEDIKNEMEEITKRSIATLGENLFAISQRLVDDYSQLQRVISTIVSKT